MKLNDFINKRLGELKMNRSALVEFGVGWATLSNITKGRPISEATKEKLAKALQCTQGEIQACLAEQNPLKDVVVSKKSIAKKQPSVMATVDKLEKMIKETPYVTPEPDEPAEVFSTEPDAPYFPEYNSPYEEEKEESAEEYRQKLRDMCLRIFATGLPGVHTMEKIYADIGYALVKELAKDET